MLEDPIWICNYRFDMAYPSRPLADRFWEKVIKADGGCWNWVGARQQFGYGTIFVQKIAGKTVLDRAHRVSWKLHNGEIPLGIFVLHHCDNPRCVRPDHLYLGTVQDNTDDRQSRNRWKRIKPHDQWGEKNPNAILSDKQVAAMLEELSLGGRPVSVARKYGIKYQTLWAIRRRKTPGH